jgi:hypothetical protein
MKPLDKVLAEVDSRKEEFIKNLSDAVAIKSVSAWPETRDVSLYHSVKCFQLMLISLLIS